MQHSEARERVLQAAEQLFAERGYTAVTIKEISTAAGIHHASLYHHAPGGKEQLYREVTERTLHRHQEGIAAAIQRSEGDFRAQLQAVAAWLVSQAPMDLIRMVHSDIPALSPATADHLFELAYNAMLVPVGRIFYEAQARGEITHPNIGNIAGALFSAIEGLHTIPAEYRTQPLFEMANQIIDVFIGGLQKPAAT